MNQQQLPASKHQYLVRKYVWWPNDPIILPYPNFHEAIIPPFLFVSFFPFSSLLPFVWKQEDLERKVEFFY